MEKEFELWNAGRSLKDKLEDYKWGLLQSFYESVDIHIGKEDVDKYWVMADNDDYSTDVEFYNTKKETLERAKEFYNEKREL